MAEPIRLEASLTAGQQRTLARQCATLQEQAGWRGLEPVALLDRCWLRLELVAIDALPARLPPDASEAAPELVLYRQLVAAGTAPLEAQRRCWDAFGELACREALQRYWQAHERQHDGWTLEAYLALRRRYRAQFEVEGPRLLPLLILARGGSREPHRLLWLPPSGRSMRHTCA